MLPKTSIMQFYCNFTEKSKEECWPWTGQVEAGGRYGSYNTQRAHRVMYRLTFGEFDKSLSVMHTCDNTLCVNPYHLRLGTHAANMADMARKGRAQHYNADKTHCKHGHSLSGNNLYIRADGRRDCKACKYIRNKRKNELYNVSVESNLPNVEGGKDE